MNAVSRGSSSTAAPDQAAVGWAILDGRRCQIRCPPRRWSQSLTGIHPTLVRPLGGHADQAHYPALKTLNLEGVWPQAFLLQGTQALPLSPAGGDTTPDPC